jgi:plasmid stabilization system protein ParE
MTREVIASPYIIPYRVKGDAIEILNVFHSAQKR